MPFNGLALLSSNESARNGADDTRWRPPLFWSTLSTVPRLAWNCALLELALNLLSP